MSLLHDEEMVKTAYIIAVNNGFMRIPLMDEVAALPPTWVRDIMRIRKEVKRQKAHIAPKP